ncbi:MAG: hypothetical protein PHU25_02710 [Deltaproteobacteria bacterium]|nr:hypothetical protein [Deltaproteobacteria bacterium]
MHRVNLKVLCAFAALLAGPVAACEAVIEDYEVKTCDPDPPASCADLGDTDAERVGCCTDGAKAVWWCEGGALKSLDCGELTCDYDTKLKTMACVD